MGRVAPLSESAHDTVGTKLVLKVRRALQHATKAHHWSRPSVAASHGTFDQLVDVPMPQVVERIVEQPVPQERSYQRIVEQRVLFLVRQVVEDRTVMDQIMSQERISERNVEQSVDVPKPENYESNRRGG